MFKKPNLIYFLLLFLSIVLFDANGQNKDLVKIACVGNSITYGSDISNRENNVYPVQFQNILGDHYLLKNFGVSGKTLLKKRYDIWGAYINNLINN